MKMPTTPRSQPIVGVPCCVKSVDGHDYYSVGTKYADALLKAAQVTPLLIPAMGDGSSVTDLLALCDGLYLTGSVSNVEPRHYQGSPSAPGTLHDPRRDSTTLPLIRHAINQGLPLFAICRGFQEVNVALGGTLHQLVHEVPGLMDHREDRGLTPDEYFAPAHPVTLSSDGLLCQLVGSETVQVNSLHHQGVDRLASGLEVEAVAPDGLVEAFRIVDSMAFAYAVQWHPEWKVLDNPFSTALFAAFGEACRQHRQHKDIP